MNSYYKILSVYFFFGVMLLMTPASAFTYEMAADDAPDTSLDVSCDDFLLLPGISCVLSLQASDLPAIQYAGLELRYDAARLTFLQERPGTVFDGNAVTIARHLPDGRLGVSVSSTAGERLADGDIIYMDFVIRNGAPDGTAAFSIDYLEFTDRDGSPRPVPLPEATDITIPPYLSDAGITGPGPVTIARGSELLFSFHLSASGITADDLADPERFTADMIIVDTGLWDGSAPIPDPAAFDRIVPLTYTGMSSGQFRFEAPFPPEQPVGSWQVVAYFQLDDQPELIAGYGSDQGSGGLLDDETFTAVEVTVTTPRVTIAEWTFDDEQWTADTGLFTNFQPDSPAEFTLFGARFSGWTTGYSGRAPNSNNWQQEANGDDGDGGNNGDSGKDGNDTDGGGDDNGDGDSGDSESDDNGNGNGSDNDNFDSDFFAVHDKYWQARLSTEGYHELTLQFRMNGSGTGPRNFRLYYSIDGGTEDGSVGWQPVPDGEIEAGTSWALFSVNLPTNTADMSDLFLRWVRIGNTSIAGNDIGPTGTNRLDDVRITGAPLDTEEMFVWPGNTRGEGTVTEADVLNLALYWMSTGPERVPRSIAWSQQPVVRWVPESAAHADTDGDGRVGYRDLLAIGRNFGQTVDSNPQKIAAKTAKTASADNNGVAGANHAGANHTVANPAHYAPPLLSKSLPVLSAQETVRVVLQSGLPVQMLGISTRFSLDQLPPDAWELVEFAPGDWAKDWLNHDRLIRFHHGRSLEAVNPADYLGENTQGRHDKTAIASDGTQSGTQIDKQSNTWSAAWAHAGPAAPVQTTELVTLIIRAHTDWDTTPVLNLRRTSLSIPDGLDGHPDTGSWKLIRQDRPIDAGRDPAGDIPLATRLHANYPNPFNPFTTLSYDLHLAGEVRVSVYDALGRRIAILTDTRMDTGRHELTWDASRQASGMYLVRLETPHTTQTRQIMLVK